MKGVFKLSNSIVRTDDLWKAEYQYLSADKLKEKISFSEVSMLDRFVHFAVFFNSGESLQMIGYVIGATTIPNFNLFYGFEKNPELSALILQEYDRREKLYSFNF